MTNRILLDMVPSGGRHGERGIGRYVRGLGDAVAALPPEMRDRILALAPGSTPLEPFGVRSVPEGQVPRWLPAVLGAGLATRRARSRAGTGIFHATDPQRPLGGGSDQIVTVYDLIPLREEGLLASMRPDHRWAYGRYLRQIKSAQRVIAISRTTADDVVGRLGVAPDRVDVVYPVVAAPGRRERQPSHDPIFLLLGALDPHKRPELAVRALARFRDRHGAGRLRVIGPAYGEQLEPVRREIDRLGVGAHVTCEGRVGDLELEAAFATATALITTSRIEGFGLPPVEALIRGVPVIAVETDAARETIGGYARLVSDDPDAMADAMGQLKPVDVAVSERLAARFSTAAATRALQGIYAKVLD